MRAYKVSFGEGAYRIVFASSLSEAEEKMNNYWGNESMDYTINKIELIQDEEAVI